MSVARVGKVQASIVSSVDNISIIIKGNEELNTLWKYNEPPLHIHDCEKKLELEV